MDLDQLIKLTSAAAFAAITLVLLYAILSPRVHDGVIVKAGLIVMAAGYGCKAALLWGALPPLVMPLLRAQSLVNLGLAVVLVGYLLRSRREGHPVRRRRDWIEGRERRAVPREPRLPPDVKPPQGQQPGA